MTIGHAVCHGHATPAMKERSRLAFGRPQVCPLGRIGDQRSARSRPARRHLKLFAVVAPEH